MSETTLSNDLLNLLTNDQSYIFVPLEVLKQPFDGSLCYANRYWLIVQDHALIYCGKNKRSYSPQCNSLKETAEHLLKGVISRFQGWDCRVELIEYAFTKNKDYL